MNDPETPVMVEFVRRLNLAVRVVAQAVETNDEGLFIAALNDINHFSDLRTSLDNLGVVAALIMCDYDEKKVIETLRDSDRHNERFTEAMEHLGFHFSPK